MESPANPVRFNSLYPAFVLLLLYGLRRGEVLGLRWRDVDQADGEIRIRQQILRVRGQLQPGPVKTSAGRRDLPMLPLASDVLALRTRTQEADRLQLGRAWEDTGLVFTTRTGRPIEPRNLVRSFHRICAAHDLRPIAVHHLRHTTATLLKNPACPGPRRSAHSWPLPPGRHPGDLYPRGPRRSAPGAQQSQRRSWPEQRRLDVKFPELVSTEGVIRALADRFLRVLAGGRSWFRTSDPSLVRRHRPPAGQAEPSLASLGETEDVPRRPRGSVPVVTQLVTQRPKHGFVLPPPSLPLRA